MQREQLLKKLGQKLREARVNKGLSQQDVANLFEKDRQTIQRIETGNTNPSIFYLYQICKVLGVTIKDVFTDIGED